MDYDVDHDDPIALLTLASAQTHRAGHFASECMQDHLDDQGVVRDMHEIINSLVPLRTAIVLAREILEARRDGTSQAA